MIYDSFGINARRIYLNYKKKNKNKLVEKRLIECLVIKYFGVNDDAFSG